ncbi:MAG: winged helix-turn-helix transcriptional regulator [Candidatus Cloacimonetes bacterium]|nr:winged helix-turn-helix transcriptional regulator [Candidatus Cloacimonadota bacterium]
MFNEKVFKALADKNRRKIIQLLRREELTAGEIAEQFNISKPAISEHLKILRNADLIDSEREGQFIRYFLNTSILEEVVSFFLAIINKEEE